MRWGGMFCWWRRGVGLWSTAAVAQYHHKLQRGKRKIIETSHERREDGGYTLEQELQTDLERKLDAVLHEALKECLHGIGFAIAVSVDGEMKFRKAYGLKDFENLVPAESVEDFKVAVYSCTKPFTALSWMRYMDKNQLEFESEALRVHRVLGEYPKVGYLGIKHRKRKLEPDYYKIGLEFVNVRQRRVALGAHHLLTHMSGLQRDTFGENYTTYSSASQVFDTLKHFPENLYGHPVYHNYYSNFGFEVVGTMLERLQANSFHNYLWEQAADLNMTNTTVGHDGEVLMDTNFPGLWGRYKNEQIGLMGRAPGNNLTSHYASCGLVSDVDDLNKFGVVSAEMYKQAFLTERNCNEPEKHFPLSREATRMQLDHYFSIGYIEEEVFSCMPGWRVSRQLLNNVEDKRKLNLRMHHGGLGYGSRAFLSASFHNIRVDDRRGRDSEKARQVEPELFYQGTILGCDKRQPTDEECLTKWELPPHIQLEYSLQKWVEYADRMWRFEWDEVLEVLLAYDVSTKIYLHLMITLPTNARGQAYDRDFYNDRLTQLLIHQKRYKRKVEKRIKRLERKIFRQVIREHRRTCRGEKDALSHDEIEALLENADLYKKNFKLLLKRLDQFQDLFTVDSLHQERIMAAHRDPDTDWDAFAYPENVDRAIAERVALKYDIRQPFNLPYKRWPRAKAFIESENFRPVTPNDGGRFDEIDLGEARNCRCGKWLSLAHRYASPIDEEDDNNLRSTFQVGGETFYNDVDLKAIATRIRHENVSTPRSPKKIYQLPHSWLPRSSDEPSNDDVNNDDAELEQKHVVVSMVANQRSLNIEWLGRLVDEIVAQHYFSRDVREAESSSKSPPSLLLTPEQSSSSSARARPSSSLSLEPEESDPANNFCKCS